MDDLSMTETLELTLPSLRDRFAIAALTATINFMQDRMESYPEMARRCYAMADAMMKARDENP